MLPSFLSGGLDHLLLIHKHSPPQIFQNALCIVHSQCLVGSSSEAALVLHNVLLRQFLSHLGAENVPPEAIDVICIKVLFGTKTWVGGGGAQMFVWGCYGPPCPPCSAADVLNLFINWWPGAHAHICNQFCNKLQSTTLLSYKY